MRQRACNSHSLNIYKVVIYFANFMPTITIPSQEEKRFVKPSRGEVFGNLWATKNIDLEANRGKIRLSERIYRLFDSGDDGDFDVPVAFIRTDADKTDRWWVLGQSNVTSTVDGLMFKTTGKNPLIGWTQDAISNTPTAAMTDMEIFGQANSYDRLVVARNTDLSMLNNGVWTASWWQTTLSGTALTGGKSHILHQFINLLLIANGNTLHTLDDSLVKVENRITLPKEYEIIWMADDGYRVYIGTRHLRGGVGLIFPWNGTTKTYDSPLSPDSDVSYAGCIDENGIMHTINGKGQLLIYDGNGFAEVAALPITESGITWKDNRSVPIMVHHNGMCLVGNRIHILLDASPGNPGNGWLLLENMLGGIWVYDKGIGLYHKYSLGQYDGSINNEWGAGFLSAEAALVETNPTQGKFLAGCAYWPSDEVGGSAVPTIVTSKMKSTVDNRGYFITSQILASSVRAFWKRLTLTFKKLENSTDRIIVKYRNDKTSALYNTEGYVNATVITWTSTTTFTSIQALFAEAVVGQEVEVMVGKGAGALAHISAVNYSAPTYTITLDEAIPNVSGDAAVRLMNWTKLGAISSQTIAKQLYKIAKRSKWIQFKVELRGTESSPEFEELLLEFNLSKR